MMNFLENIAFSLNLSMKQFWVILAIIIMIITIPLAVFLANQTQIFKSKASGKKTTNQIATTSAQLKKLTPSPQEIPATSPLTDLETLLENPLQPAATDAASPLEPTPTPNLAFGPLLTAKVALEGRPTNKQAAKIFIGISAGTAQSKPSYLITFTIDFPDSGSFSGLSLAGLNPGSTYTAYLKGPAQIDNSSTFVMSPTETILNNGQALLLLSGDLNEDNTINSADYTIAKTAYGAITSSANWNERADINRDGMVNNLDMAYILKNFGKSGVSDIWYSPNPAIATTSAILTTPAAGSASGTGGYWIWVP